MEEYFLNTNKNCCAKIPSRSENYLTKNNYLSEFNTTDDKEIVLDNLGINLKLQELVNLINTKVIRQGDIAWDLKPTLGNMDRVLSSDIIYKTLLNYVTSSVLELKMQAIYKTILTKIEDILNLMNSLTSNGVALSGQLGDNTNIGINQKTLTEIINDLYLKFAQCSGDSPMLMLEADPTFFTTESTTVNVTAYASSYKFDNIEVYFNDELKISQENILNLYYSEDIYDTTTIKAKATILGREYEEEITIMKTDDIFYLGSATSTNNFQQDYIQVINNSNNFRTPSYDGYYDVNVRSDGDKIYLVVSEADNLKFGKTIDTLNGIPTITMNGLQIPFIKHNLISNSVRVYESSNLYKAGTYRIRIMSTLIGTD